MRVIAKEGPWRVEFLGPGEHGLGEEDYAAFLWKEGEEAPEAAVFARDPKLVYRQGKFLLEEKMGRRGFLGRQLNPEPVTASELTKRLKF